MVKGKKAKAVAKKAAKKVVKKKIVKKVAKKPVMKKATKKGPKKAIKKVAKNTVVKKAPKKDPKKANKKVTKKAVSKKSAKKDLKKTGKSTKKTLTKSALTKKADKKTQKKSAGTKKSDKKAPKQEAVTKKSEKKPAAKVHTETVGKKADKPSTKPKVKKAKEETEGKTKEDRVLAEAHGDLWLPSGKVICTDPGYAKEDVKGSASANNLNTLGKMYELLPGAWKYTFNVVQTDFSTRFGMLGIHHSDHDALVPQMKADGSYDLENPKKATETTGCGVDSGRFGFFDADLYHNDAACQNASYSSFDDMVEKLDAPTDDDGAKRPAVLTSSGFGDGIYDLKAFLDKNNKLQAAYIVFVDELHISLMEQICKE